MNSLFEIEKLIDTYVLQNIQDNFAKATGIGSVMVDYKGEPITYQSSFTPFCNEVRKNPKYKEKCSKCDALGGVQSAITGKPHIYMCHMGLIDFAVPIILQNTYLGAMLAGQIRLEEDISQIDDIEEITKLTNWQDDEKLKALYNELSIRSIEQVEASANLMYQIINYMIEIASINLIEELKDEKMEQAITTSSESKSKKNKSYSKDIKKAVKYIDDNIKKTITLNEVSNHINLSSHYLSKLFKKEMEMNFTTYLTHKKIEIAKEMLLDSEIPIINIAIDLSYHHPNYFSKVFKKTVGITPTEYREENIDQVVKK